MMNRFGWLVVAAVCWGAGADVVRLTALPEEPLVHWAFEGSDFDPVNGVLCARGTAGDSFALNLPETGVTPTVSGMRGGGVSFSDRQYLTRWKPTGMPDGRNGFTIALWAAPTSGNSGFISWGANASAQSVGLGLQSGQLNFFLYSGGDLCGAANAQLYSGTWHHFAAVYDPDADPTCHVYVDGAESYSGSWTLAPAINLTGDNSFLFVGSVLRLNNREFAGGMDELMVFDRALSAAEIGAVMRMNGGGNVAFDASMDGHDLEVDQGTVLTVETDTSAVIGSVKVADPFAATDWTERIVAYYPFADAETLLADASGHGHTLAQDADNTCAVTARDGAAAFSQDGKSLLVFADAASLDSLPHGDQAYTVAFRVKPDADCPVDGGFYRWGVLGANFQANAARFNANHSQYAFYNWGSADIVYQGAATGWRHLLITYDPRTKTRTLYENGVAVDATAATAALSVPAQNFRIGAAGGQYPNNLVDAYFKGEMDDFLILACAVDAAGAAEIAQVTSLEDVAALRVAHHFGAWVEKSGEGTLTVTHADVTEGAIAVRDGTVRLEVGPLVARYTFDDAENPGADSSGFGRHLVPIGANEVTVSGGVAEFDGASALTFADEAMLDALPHGDSAWTVAFHFWADSSDGSDMNGGFYSWGPQGATRGVNGVRFTRMVSATQEVLRFSTLSVFNWGNDLFVTPAGTALAGVWRHLAVTYDPDTRTRRVYLDGAEVETHVASAAQDVRAENFGIGRAQLGEVGKYGYFTGLMDDFRIYAGTLDAAHVARLAREKPGAAAAAPACAVGAAGRLEAVTGVSAVSDLALDGAVEVAAGATLTVQGMCVLNGTVGGAGTFAPGEGATVAVSAAGAGRVEMTGTVVLPEAFTVQLLDVTRSVEVPLVTAGAIVGDADGAELEVENLPAGATAALRVRGGTLSARVTYPGMLFIVR